MTTPRKRKGMGEYRSPRHGTMFTLPEHEKTRLNRFASTTGRTLRQTLIDALSEEYVRHGLPPFQEHE